MDITSSFGTVYSSTFLLPAYVLHEWVLHLSRRCPDEVMGLLACMPPLVSHCTSISHLALHDIDEQLHVAHTSSSLNGCNSRLCTTAHASCKLQAASCKLCLWVWVSLGWHFTVTDWEKEREEIGEGEMRNKDRRYKNPNHSNHTRPRHQAPSTIHDPWSPHVSRFMLYWIT